MSEPAESLRPITWERIGDRTFRFHDMRFGIELRLKNTRQEDGHVKADLYAYRESVKLLVRPSVNLTSDVTLPKLAKSLLSQQDQYDWHFLLETVCSVLVEQMDLHGIVSRLTEPQGESLRTRMIFKDFIPEGLVSGIIAHGGSGKSMVGSMLSLAIATGEKVGPFTPQRTGTVLYLDWENNWQLHAKRIKRICDGLGLPFPYPERLIHYEARARLASAESEILELAHENDVVLTILDSIGYAAGGNLNDSDVATAATLVLKHLPGTKIMIAHVAKSTLGEGGANKLGPTGSAFFWNGPQAVYELRATDPALDGSVTLSVYHNKANVGARLPRPLGIHIAFDDSEENSGPITPTALQVRGDRPEGAAMSQPSRVMDALGSRRAKMTALEIAQVLFEIPDKTRIASVERTLRELRDRGRIVDFGSAPRMWALAADTRGLSQSPEESGGSKRGFPEPEAPSLDFRCQRCGDPAVSYTETGQPACEVHAL